MNTQAPKNNPEWNKSDWKNNDVLQQPNWPDSAHLKRVCERMEVLPPLVFAGEIDSLKKRLKKAGRGNAFILQAGDCAESFDQCKSETIRETLKVILQMASILTYAGEKNVIKIGRIAGQYAKPRSSDFEERDGVRLPSYRGDIVNRNDFSEASRIPDPENLFQAYYLSAATLNLLRGFTRGGFASLHNIHKWNKEFIRGTEAEAKFERLATEIDKAIAFMKAIGLDHDHVNEIKEVKFYTSHEALILQYEEALTRKDSLSGGWYDCSAHMVWIGDRTRHPDHGHVEFLKGVRNPVGMKIGPKHDRDDIMRVLDKLNPENEEGKICFITRMGVNEIENGLPPLVRAIKSSGQNVVWCCDPMHANTFQSGSYKTRSTQDIMKEIKSFFQILHSEEAIPGGVHLELTGLDVTECIGGQIGESDLSRTYTTNCDPRLNARQGIELAFNIAEMLR